MTKARRSVTNIQARYRPIMTGEYRKQENYCLRVTPLSRDTAQVIPMMGASIIGVDCEVLPLTPASNNRRVWHQH